tara:strand:+ start:5012 stop:7972 length:2961 start_codon:yes stop_codon:yes gene_type:complete
MGSEVNAQSNEIRITGVSPKHVAEGSKVTIFGSGFLNELPLSVFIGDTEAMIINKTNIGVMVEVPATSVGVNNVTVLSSIDGDTLISALTILTDRLPKFSFHRDLLDTFYPSQKIIIDIDADGDLDIVFGSGSLFLLENNGNGQFSDKVELYDQFNYESPKIFPIDMDKDLRTDLLVSTSYSVDPHEDTVYELVWIEQNEVGFFELRENFGNIGPFAGGYINDINNDGHNDLISIRTKGEELGILLNDGEGTITESSTSINSINKSFANIRLFDSDNDFDMDIFIDESVGAGDDSFSIVENQGGLSFKIDSVFTEEGVGVYNKYTADLDNDGDPDILSLKDYKLTVYINTGSGEFIKGDELYDGIIRDMYLVDFDGDGDIDVIPKSEYIPNFIYYPNQGDGSFGEEIPLLPTRIEISNLADFDGDGDLDVLAESNDSKLVWFENGSKNMIGKAPLITNIKLRTISGNSVISIYGSGFIPDSLSLLVEIGGIEADIISKGANVIKVKVPNLAYGSYSVEISNTFGTYITALPLNIVENITPVFNSVVELDAFEDFRYLELLDIDLDSLPDIIYGAGVIEEESSSTELGFYENLGNNNFSGQVEISEKDYPYNSQESFYTADINLDGYPDLITSLNTSYTTIWINDQNGSFSDNVILGGNMIGNQDIDLDGNLDFINKRGSWFRNLGELEFQSVQVQEPSVVDANLSEDLDNDGNIDFIMTLSGVNFTSISLYRNIGSGSFKKIDLYEGFENEIVKLYSDDLDNDGDNDILAVHQLSESYGDLYWYEFEWADSSLIKPYLIEKNVIISGLPITVDMDGDGYMDIMPSDSEGGIYWYHNQRNGEFLKKEIEIFSSEGIYRPKVADMDNDGDLDIIALLEGSKILYAENKAISTSNEIEEGVASNFYLHQNYPNPFNPTTTIRYAIPGSFFVNITVFDLAGRKVATLVNEKKSIGTHTVKFDASGLASGVYYYRVSTRDFVQTKKLTLIK